MNLAWTYIPCAAGVSVQNTLIDKGVFVASALNINFNDTYFCNNYFIKLMNVS